MTLRVFGLTGGIGSGKSEVAKRLLERGLPVVNADQLARLAVARDSLGLAQLVAHFGGEVLTATGELVANWYTGTPTAMPLAWFSPNRFAAEPVPLELAAS